MTRPMIELMIPLCTPPQCRASRTGDRGSSRMSSLNYEGLLYGARRVE